MGWILIAGGFVGLLVLLVLPAAAHALGGGGIGGFGDGGGGGGGGGLSGGGHFFGGGGGGSEEGSTEILARLLIVGLIVLYWIVGILRVRRGRRRAEQRESFSLGLVLRTLRRLALWPVDWVIECWRLGRRRRRVRLAAAEASESDPRFAPDVVCSDAERLFRAVQAAWTQDDRVELARLVARDLMVEWEKRLKGFARRGWNNEIELCGPVHVDYVGLRNAADERGKRVVVRVSTRLRDVVIDSHGSTIHRKNSIADTHHICEYWTLGVSGEGWMLVSIEQHHEGLHQLQEPVVPSPWSDTETLHREATLELIAGTRVENAQIHTIASTDLTRDARAEALDISLVDDRFAPRVLAGEADYAVRAWAEAIDGDDAPLSVVTSPTALAELLYPGDPDCHRRLVVRGPRIRSVRILQLGAHDTPPWMLVELHVSGRRYQEDRTTTTILDGDRSIQTAFTMRWRMELTDDDSHPWRIAAVVQIQPSQQRAQEAGAPGR
jgi:predicted lipid-binding transport protein (Tim44 family)